MTKKTTIEAQQKTSKTAKKQEKTRKVVWRPQPKQALMMSRSEYEGFYGGAAGGGKSDYLLCEALRQVHIPHYRAIIFRKDFGQASELINRSLVLYKAAFPAAVYNQTKHFWKFPSGSEIWFGSMHNTKDKLKYQGKRYDFIGFDELTHFTFDEYSYMYSRNRPGGEGTRVYRRATGNPGGIGHGWVKQYFVKAAEPGTPVITKIQSVDQCGKIQVFERSKIFIPSKVYDNKELLKNDPQYVANLSQLSADDKAALLEGNWDTFSGQVFTEWINNPDNYGTNNQKWTHVIDEFRVPDSWKIIRGFDFGYSKPFSVGWYAVDHDGRLYRIREYYGCTKTNNEGVKLTPQEIAKKIKAVEYVDENLKRKKIYGVADPSIWDKSRGESIAEMMESCGVYFEKGDNSRLAGKMQFHYRLAFDEIGIPMMYIFKNCKNFIRTIPDLVYSDRDVEDIDTTQEDHIYDECRYVLMTHPVNPRKNAMPIQPLEDPLNLYSDRR